MNVSFKTYVIREAILIAVLNASINGAYTWYLWRSLDLLTLFGENGVGLDLALTPVFIGVLSTLLGTHLIRQKIGDGRVVVGRHTRAHPVLHLLPQGILARSLLMGLACGLLLGVPLWLGLQASSLGSMSHLAAYGAKVTITVALSLVIVPMVVFCALADIQRPTSRPALA